MVAFGPVILDGHITAKLVEGTVHANNWLREAQIFPKRLLLNVAKCLCWAVTGFAFAGAVVMGSDAHAASDYPQKPIRIFVPYGPGGAGDLTIRLLADKLSQNLKQPFIIENRPGAGNMAAIHAR
jgi:hypothetical protein